MDTLRLWQNYDLVYAVRNQAVSICYGFPSCFPLFMPFSIVPLFSPYASLISLPRAGQCYQHSFSSPALEGEGAEHPCCGTRTVGCSGGMHRGVQASQSQKRKLAEKEAVCCSSQEISPPKVAPLPWGQAGFSGKVGQSNDPLPRGLNHAMVLLVTFAFYHQSDTQE